VIRPSGRCIPPSDAGQRCGTYRAAMRHRRRVQIKLFCRASKKLIDQLSLADLIWNQQPTQLLGDGAVQDCPEHACG
jgi:hypothetical protein